tara:strand:- start:1175 stop:3025 length:1851 start_codon:yes stop_codon:yes gene_type:complete
MAISIPSNITLNRRDYGIGEAIKLDDADLPADDKHPLVVYCLKYIASPVSSGVYSKIEDSFGNYLDSGLMERIANDDSEFDFNKEEYDRHLSSAKKYMKELTLETLILKLKPYVGSENKKWISANIRATQKEGLETSVSDFSNLSGRQRALSFNVKGEVSAKINQAIRRDLPYYPALQYFVDRGHKSSKYEQGEDIENLEDIQGVISFEKDNQPYEMSVKLPDRKTRLKLDVSVYTLTINMGKVFETIAEEQGISYILRKSYNSLMKAFNKFKFHPDNEIKSDMIEDNINAIYEFNDILREGTFDSDEDGLRYTDEQRKNAIKEGDFEVEMKKFENLMKKGLISNKTYVDFKNGKRFTSFPVDKGLLNFVKLNIDFKRKLPENKDKSPPDYYNEIELLFQRKSSAKTRAKERSDAKIEQTRIISAPSGTAYSERQFFIDESWKTPDDVKLNFDALKYHRELNDVFKKLLIPSDSTIIMSFYIAEKSRQKYSTKKLTEEDKKELDDAYLDVVRFDDYEFESKKYDANPLREIRPSFESRPSKLQNEKLGLKLPSKQGVVQVQDSKDKGGTTIAREKAQGVVGAGLPATNYSADLNAFIYYIMRQTNKLEGKLGGEII